ncbi:ABC transporter substrate-binding protein [Microbacterium hominis]|uniref:Carbohydrate ABC transporter substrate-binding protein n=1 Tax=Microbacterium hominis TaxID=162426 RepID=A0A7D4QKF0_9MICO|nr:ABC transporter substrate-binding protein [Microbacterium hominis]QKJ20416.1 carbohydrate ABC transporter substrate-binding protein [Microbacterium hominis]
MSQQTFPRPLRWSLLAAPVAGALVLAGCSGSGDSGSSDEPEAGAGFTVMVAQANDADDFYAQTLSKFSEETGIEVEVIPYPSDSYNTQVTTQLQAGNAADMMILAPGTGQPISVVTLAEAGFLAPLGGASADVVPADSTAQYEVDGELYAQPTALIPVGLVYNDGAADAAGISEYPASYEDMLEACATARDGGLSFTVLAGAIPFNTGLMSMLISATRVYEGTPDWNEQRAAGEVTFADSDGWQETLEDIVEMNESGCFQDGVAGGTFDNITAGLGGGTSLSAAVPGNAATSIGEAAGTDLTVRSFPPADGQSDYVLASANYAWAVNAEADEAKQESMQQFLDWVSTPEQAVAFAELSGAVPIVGGTPDNLLAPYAPIGSLIESGATAGIPNAAWPNPAVYDALGVGVQGLLTGQKTVDQVLEEMDAAWG